MALLRTSALVALASALAFAEDPVAALTRRIDAGEIRLPFDGPYGYLPALLDALHIPVESQVAVFSKTSIQSLRIEPSNPRVLYFNDSVAVGWVHGGFIELAALDPGSGLHYYSLQQRPDEHLVRRHECVNCHTSEATRVSSVISAPDGIPSGETDVDGRSPFSKLWGGWYVTGAALPAGHMGNKVYAKSEIRELTPVLEPRVALTKTSDVVALMVFTHQMHMMDLLAHPDNINELVDYLLFVDEPSLSGPVRGDSAFAEKFTAAGPFDHAGRSLRQFDLEHRLMRYPCSYMIYTDAFDGLPAATREAIYRRMWAILSGELDSDTRYRRLSHADRQAIAGILRETKKDLPAWFAPQLPAPLKN